MTSILVLLPLLLREAVHVRHARPSSGGRIVGGVTSAWIWNLCHLGTLALALWSVWHSNTWLAGVPGMATLWGGTLLRILAYRELGRRYTVRIVVRPDFELVRSGPYRFLRHPLHLGLVTEITGLLLIAPSWWSGALLVAASATLLVRNAHEEAALATLLGSQYQDYARGTFDPIDLVPATLRRRLARCAFS